jgi:hypothetical protein
MEKPSRDSYSPTNFIEWENSGSLNLTPKFQRRPVWKLPQKSFLIDTLIREMPVPPIYMRNLYDAKRKKAVREVVDGQQRIRAVLDYIAGKYALSKKVAAEYQRKKFDQLTSHQRKSIMSYRLNCETFDDISDPEVLEIFQRLNMHSVPLSKQELRNGRYFGAFKQACYMIAYDHLEFWRRHNIFSESAISRMLEVELTSELLIAQMDGMQDKKQSIDKFYAEYDGRFAEYARQKRRFADVIDQISETVGDDLKHTEFRRRPMFYTLFCVVYHRTYGLKNQPKHRIRTTKKTLARMEQNRLRDAVAELSQVIQSAKEEDPIPERLQPFVNASSGQTDNIQPRQQRFDTLYNEAFR